jgi:putative heme transporter
MEVPAAAERDALDGAARSTAADTEENRRQHRHSKARKNATRTVKIILFLFVINYLVLPQIGGLRNALDQLTKGNPFLLVLGLGLELASLVAYAQLTRTALTSDDNLSLNRLVRIQLATKAVTNVVPGGSAAGSALGYRLLTLAGAKGSDAGFALATAGLGSAVVLNMLLWLGLLVSIPTRGFNPLYVTAAIAGVIVMLLFAGVVFALMKGSVQAERVLRAAARRVHLNEDRAGEAVRHVAARLQELASEPQLMKRVVLWAAANWLLDAAALWVFVRAYGGTLWPDALLVSFGLANVLAAIPITPGGLGIVEGVYLPTLIGFGITPTAAGLAVPTYRLAQYWLPIPLGAVSYFSLRFGPGRIDRARRLDALRKVAAEAAEDAEGRLEWAERYGHRSPSETVAFQSAAAGAPVAPGTSAPPAMPVSAEPGAPPPPPVVPAPLSPAALRPPGPSFDPREAGGGGQQGPD